jgi:hypothetical protein
VVEECDECCFWLDFIKDLGIGNEPSREKLHREADELLKVFSKTKKKIKENLNQINNS